MKELWNHSVDIGEYAWCRHFSFSDEEYRYDEQYMNDICRYKYNIKRYLYTIKIDINYKYADFHMPYRINNLYSKHIFYSSTYSIIQDIDVLLYESDWVRPLPQDYDFSFYKNLPVYRPLSEEEEAYISLLYNLREIILNVAPIEIVRSSIDIEENIIEIKKEKREFYANILRLSEAWRYQDYNAIHCALLEIYENTNNILNASLKIEKIGSFIGNHPSFPKLDEKYYYEDCLEGIDYDEDEEG